MDTAVKHLGKIKKQIDAQYGRGKSNEILAGLDALSGSETPEEIAIWAGEIIDRLESAIPPDELIEMREECACIKATMYSAYNKKYFKEIRGQYPDDDEAYLKAVADFLDGRGRCGNKVEYVNGEIISHFGFGNSCICYVIKGGWQKPPSTTWCRCCQGTLKSIYQFVFIEKDCHMDIIETFATGGTDCVFRTWFTDKQAVEQQVSR
jgi:hypothetical protein